MMASQTWLVLDGKFLNDRPRYAAKHKPTGFEVKVELTWPKASISYNTDAPPPDQPVQPGKPWKKMQQEKEITVDTASDDEVIYFAIHMPPKIPNSRNQPFSSINDGIVLLPEGHVFRIKAKISMYRNLKKKKYRCTNGVSMSDWQVSDTINWNG